MKETSDPLADTTKATVEVIKEIGFFGYRTLITLNSGAFVVILSFISNSKDNSEFELNSISLKRSLMAFLLGIALTFAAATIAYTQAQLNLQAKALSGGSSVTGHMLWLLSPVVFTFIAFLVGASFAISGITPK